MKQYNCLLFHNGQYQFIIKIYSRTNICTYTLSTCIQSVTLCVHYAGYIYIYIYICISNLSDQIGDNCVVYNWWLDITDIIIIIIFTWVFLVLMGNNH